MFHGLTVEHCLQTEHAVGGRVLGTDVDHVVISAEEFVLLGLQEAIFVEIELQTVVRLFIVFKCILVVVLPVLTEGVALEVATQEQTTHIGMS